MTEIKMSVAATEAAVPMTIEAGISMADTPAYTGPYVFTPSGEAQVIGIAGHRASQDIVIGPVPANYGLITWNGSAITVS